MTTATAEGLSRVCVKIPARESRPIGDEAALFVPILHEWIRDRTLDLVMLDVADYAHVPEGPGIMLICHEVNFGLDRTDGSFGLLAQRRTPFDGSTANTIAVTLRQALEVAARLEAHPSVAGKLEFDVSNVRVEANDRLLAPNTDAGYEVFGPEVQRALEDVFGGATVRIERIENDPRDRLAVDARVDVSARVGDHVDALTTSPAEGSV